MTSRGSVFFAIIFCSDFIALNEKNLCILKLNYEENVSTSSFQIKIYTFHLTKPKIAVNLVAFTKICYPRLVDF